MNSTKTIKKHGETLEKARKESKYGQVFIVLDSSSATSMLIVPYTASNSAINKSYYG